MGICGGQLYPKISPEVMPNKLTASPCGRRIGAAPISDGPRAIVACTVKNKTNWDPVLILVHPHGHSLDQLILATIWPLIAPLEHDKLPVLSLLSQLQTNQSDVFFVPQ